MAEDTSVDVHPYTAQPLQVGCETASSPSLAATPGSSETSVTPPNDVSTTALEEVELKPSTVPSSPPYEPSKIQEEYRLKWITWKNCSIPIVTQNQNGPCPLIAIANILLLQGKISLSKCQTTITATELISHITDNILKNGPENAEMVLVFEQNLQDAISLLPQLFTGLDVNVKFTGVTDFEFTQACTVFDILNIPLYHGWVVDPQAYETVEAIGSMGYNELVETIIKGKMSSDSSEVTKALLAEQFLESSASQLTYHGLYELSSAMNDGELGVLFRNNHFSTIYKLKVPDCTSDCRRDPSKESISSMQNPLFVLVTDQGFLHEVSVVWEMLCNIEGDSVFVDGNFTISRPSSYDLASKTSITEEQQINQDYMVALAVQETLCQLDDTDSVLEDIKKNMSLDSQSQWPDRQHALMLTEEQEIQNKEVFLKDKRSKQKSNVSRAYCASCTPLNMGGAALNGNTSKEIRCRCRSAPGSVEKHRATPQVQKCIVTTPALPRHTSQISKPKPEKIDEPGDSTNGICCMAYSLKVSKREQQVASNEYRFMCTEQGKGYQTENATREPTSIK